MTGWWLSHLSEKYERQLGLLFPTEWNNKIHVPNHQPDINMTYQVPGTYRPNFSFAGASASFMDLAHSTRILHYFQSIDFDRLEK